MRTLIRLFGFALLLAGAAAVCARAQVLDVDQWPTRYRDSGNTMSTPVDLGGDLTQPNLGLKLRWQKAGSVPPLVYSYWSTPTEGPSVRKQLVISGGDVRDAWNGDLLGHVNGGNDLSAAVDIDSGRLLTFNGRYYLHDLKSPGFPLIATLDVPGAVKINSYPNITARKGRFLIAGEYHQRRASPNWGFAEVDSNGNVLWQRLFTGGYRIDSYDFPALLYRDLPSRARLLFQPLFSTQVAPGVLAFDLDTASTCWFDASNGWVSTPSVDEGRQIVFTAGKGGWGLCALCAYNADGGVAWTAPGPAGYLLNGPPTLGSVNADPAVFAINVGVDRAAEVYAYSRADGQGLWGPTLIPPDAWTSATYAGGKLYIGANDGLTYVLDANTGAQIATLGTNGNDGSYNERVIVGGINGYPVMYYLTRDGFLEAWSVVGTDTPEAGFLSLSAPTQVRIPSTAQVTATVVNDSGDPIEGRPVTFWLAAQKGQGYLEVVSGTTNGSGEATAIFHSDRRTGVVTVFASSPQATPNQVSVNIQITK